MKIKPLILASLSFIFSISAHALIHSNVKETYPAVIPLRHVSQADTICSGTVVGLNPPTVITARHCVEMGAFLYNGIGPTHTIVEDYESHYFSTSQARLPGDIAVLIFPRDSAKEFRKSMKDSDLFEINYKGIDQEQKVFVCGYGSTGKAKNEIVGMGMQRCGYNYAIIGDGLRRSTYVNPRVSFENMEPSIKSEFINQTVQSFLNEYGFGTRMGLGADYQDSLALTQWGDSGGPVFIKGSRGQMKILAVSSGTLNSNSIGERATFFGGFFWRLDHKWSKKILRKAFNEGADLEVGDGDVY